MAYKNPEGKTNHEVVGEALVHYKNLWQIIEDTDDVFAVASLMMKYVEENDPEAIWQALNILHKDTEVMLDAVAGTAERMTQNGVIDQELN